LADILLREGADSSIRPGETDRHLRRADLRRGSSGEGPGLDQRRQVIDSFDDRAAGLRRHPRCTSGAGAGGRGDHRLGSRGGLGGYTAICAMRNTNPVCDNAAVAEKRGGHGQLPRPHPGDPGRVADQGLEGRHLPPSGRWRPATPGCGSSPTTPRVQDAGCCAGDGTWKGFGAICAKHCDDESAVRGGPHARGRVLLPARPARPAGGGRGAGDSPGTSCWPASPVPASTPCTPTLRNRTGRRGNLIPGHTPTAAAGIASPKATHTKHHPPLTYAPP